MLYCTNNVFCDVHEYDHEYQFTIACDRDYIIALLICDFYLKRFLPHACLQHQTSNMSHHHDHGVLGCNLFVFGGYLHLLRMY